MGWTKDSVSQAPKTVYMAPPEAHPIMRVTYDENAEYPWTIEYAYLDEPQETQETIEDIMEV